MGNKPSYSARNRANTILDNDGYKSSNMYQSISSMHHVKDFMKNNKENHHLSFIIDAFDLINYKKEINGDERMTESEYIKKYKIFKGKKSKISIDAASFKQLYEQSYLAIHFDL